MVLELSDFNSDPRRRPIRTDVDLPGFFSNRVPIGFDFLKRSEVRRVIARLPKLIVDLLD